MNFIKRFMFRSENREVQALLVSLREEKALLMAERERVKRLKPLPTEVSNTLKQALERRLEEEGILKTENDPKALRAQIDLLRRHLRQELAFNEYLSENQKEGVLAFNGLPVETRKTYFEKVDAKL